MSNAVKSPSATVTWRKRCYFPRDVFEALIKEAAAHTRTDVEQVVHCIKVYFELQRKDGEKNDEG